MKLLNNFFQVAGPALSHRFDATAYLLDGGKELLLIDCGTPEGYNDCISNIRKLGYNPADISFILGTHGHYDHVGAAALFKRDFGCKLYLHEADAQRVIDGDGLKTTASLLYGSSFPPCAVDGFLKDGDEFKYDNFTLEVLHTPGHTPGSVCYILTIQGIRVLIAGDTIYGGFSIHIGSSEEQWRESLDKICSYHFDAMVIGHSNPVLLADADARLRDARASFANYYNPWFKNFKDEYKY